VGHFKRRATPVAIAFAWIIPRFPVQALALPELAMMARALPDFACCMSSLTGAALTWLRVKTAATFAGTSETMSARSFLPDGLMPAERPSARKPRAAVTLEEAESFFISTDQIHAL